MVPPTDPDWKRCQRQTTSPRRLQTAQDVIDILQEQVEAVRADLEASTLEKARLIGQLAGIALKAIEAGDLASRLEALEAILKERKQRGQS
jgi:hypothetical protein